VKIFDVIIFIEKWKKIMSFQKKEKALIFQKRILRKHNSSCHVGLGGVYREKVIDSVHNVLNIFMIYYSFL